MSSDEEELPGNQQPRIRRHKFKNFAERVAEVSVHGCCPCACVDACTCGNPASSMCTCC